MKNKRSAESAFFNLRAAITLLVCGVAACSMLSGALLAFLGSETPATPQRTLTFAERLAYQRALEDVYWRHRIWPKGRPDPKPSLDAVMSQAQLEKKVTGYLRNSQVLENYWQQPLTAAQLQTEMERMAQHTKQPEILRELFEALGNDPFVIAECLARPVLSERLVTNFSVHDQRSHAELKWRTGSWRAGAENQMPKLAAAANANYTRPTISDGAACVDDTWTATSTTNAPDARAGHTAVWTGSEMIVWGGGASGPTYLNTGGKYNPSTDSWTATSVTNAPDARAGHTAVWTGSEMIVWGGYNGSGYLNTGGRYNPGADSWVATSTTNAPAGRQEYTAVWTGSEMIVWGGYDGAYLNTGGRYNPNIDSWTPTSTANAPQGRSDHTAIWTGSEMIVWGGFFGGIPLSNGGRYNPGTDSWTATSTTNAPSPRAYHTAVWTGSEMIVWGGWDDSNFFNTGGRYNSGTDTWTATSTTNAPAARFQHTAVLAGSEMIVWGGWNGPNVFNTGGKYDSGTDSWTATSTTNAPTARYVHTAVSTTGEMIVWGGFNGSYFNTGGRYCAAPTTPTPTPTCVPGGTPGPWTQASVYPLSVSGAAVASNGTSIYAFGGNTNGGAHAEAYRYDPSANTWTALASMPTGPDYLCHAEYGGNGKIYVMGGSTGGTLNRIYDIATNSWSAGAPVPEAVFDHGHAYWNGKIYVIGGIVFGVAWNAVYAYDVATSTWSAPLSPLPQAEFDMACGAINNKIYCANGSTGHDARDELFIYDIAANSWTTGANSPMASIYPAGTVVGGKFYMIGGFNPFLTGAGARRQAGKSMGAAVDNTYLYDPVTNSWTAGPSLNITRAFANAATVNTAGGETAVVVAGSNDQGALNSVERSTLQGCGTPTPTPTPTPTATATATATPTPTARPTPTPRPVPTPRPRPSPTPRP